MTAQERGDALPPGAFDRPYPAMTAAERWHLDVYLPYSEMCMFDVLVLLLLLPPLLLLKLVSPEQVWIRGRASYSGW